MLNVVLPPMSKFPDQYAYFRHVAGAPFMPGDRLCLQAHLYVSSTLRSAIGVFHHDRQPGVTYFVPRDQHVPAAVRSWPHTKYFREYQPSLYYRLTPLVFAKFRAKWRADLAQQTHPLPQAFVDAARRWAIIEEWVTMVHDWPESELAILSGSSQPLPRPGRRNSSSANDVVWRPFGGALNVEVAVA